MGDGRRDEWLTLASGVFGVINAGADFAIAEHMTGKAKDTALAKATFSLAGGCWQLFVGGIALLKDVTLKQVDLVVEVVLGLCEIATAIAAAVQQTESDEEVGRSLGFRLGNWTVRGIYRVCDGLDNTRSPKAHIATVACGGLLLAADVADAVWTIADNA
jgi:hypothetical protein